jgi:hypothetical protein
MAPLIALISLALASSASALLPRGDIGTVCKAPVWLAFRDLGTSANTPQQGSGVCGSTVKADCNGYYVPGYCPGDNTIQVRRSGLELEDNNANLQLDNSAASRLRTMLVRLR